MNALETTTTISNCEVFTDFRSCIRYKLNSSTTLKTHSCLKILLMRRQA